MKEWKEYLFKVNGFEMTAVYNEDTIQKVFSSFIKTITAVTKGKKERIIVFMAAPPAVGKTTLCEFLVIFIKTRSRVYRHSSIRIRWISLSL